MLLPFPITQEKRAAMVRSALKFYLPQKFLATSTMFSALRPYFFSS